MRRINFNKYCSGRSRLTAKQIAGYMVSRTGKFSRFKSKIGNDSNITLDAKYHCVIIRRNGYTTNHMYQFTYFGNNDKR